MFHLLCDVAVNVQSKGGGGMAQVALDRLNVVPGPDRGHGKAVTEIVKADLRHSDRGNHQLEVMVWENVQKGDALVGVPFSW